MATGQDLIRVASGELEYTRWRDPQRGTKYGRWYADLTGSPYFGANGVPFCAMGASWCLDQLGMTPPGGHFAYVPTGIANARRAGALVPARQARPGDLVCFDWNRDGVADHVGIVVANLGWGLATIEFNTSPGTGGSQGNGGGVYRRTRAWGCVCAVIRPAYGAPAPQAHPAKLVPDGVLGPASTRAFQWVAGTPQDGRVSSQPYANRQYLPNWTTIDYTTRPGGSALAIAIQGWVKTTKDGYIGPDTIRGIQRSVGGVEADGYLGPATARAIQAWLNMKLGY